MDRPGPNPLFPMFPVYDWINDDGESNLMKWAAHAIESQSGVVPTFAPYFRRGEIPLPSDVRL